MLQTQDNARPTVVRSPLSPYHKLALKYKVSKRLLCVGKLKIYAWQITSLYYHTQTTIICNLIPRARFGDRQNSLYPLLGLSNVLYFLLTLP